MKLANRVHVVAFLFSFLWSALFGQTLFVPGGTVGSTANGSGNVGIGTNNPSAKLHLYSSTPGNLLRIVDSEFDELWIGENGGGISNRLDVRLFDTPATPKELVFWGGDATNGYSMGSFRVQATTHRFMGGNVGIGTAHPTSALHVAGTITAGFQASTSGVDYIYGNYSMGKLFVLGSQYSSGAPFLGYGVKAMPGPAGYLSSTGTSIGRSSIEANAGFVAFLTGGTQASTDGGAVNIAERMRITSIGNLGIGTSSPTARLEVSVSGSSVQPVMALSNPTNAADVGTSLEFRNSLFQGVQWLGGRIDVLREGTGAGHSFVIFNKRFDQAGSANLVSEALRINGMGNVGIGTSNPAHKLAVNGTVKAKEIIVETTGWSDYVFTPDYELASLSEVEAHIKEHQHLPGIPSAKEVAEEGVNVGEMQAKLLAKIEEMTLHLITQQKQLSAQSERIDRLEAENERLRSSP